MLYFKNIIQFLFLGLVFIWITIKYQIKKTFFKYKLCLGNLRTLLSFLNYSVILFLLFFLTRSYLLYKLKKFNWKQCFSDNFANIFPPFIFFKYHFLICSLQECFKKTKLKIMIRNSTNTPSRIVAQIIDWIFLFFYKFIVTFVSKIFF